MFLMGRRCLHTFDLKKLKFVEADKRLGYEKLIPGQDQDEFTIDRQNLASMLGEDMDSNFESMLHELLYESYDPSASDTSDN